jgi:hypothetical protein
MIFTSSVKSVTAAIGEENATSSTTTSIIRIFIIIGFLFLKF